ncbi:MAG: dTDP-4-amino-4,6-dideoxygalactose transaminase [Chlamydiales bacterium]|jgi:dTDP-4-amino-4,6-dideoxygalactose transaminase
MKVEFCRHNIEEEDILSVRDVLESLFITTGPVTSQFEEVFSRYTYLKKTVAVSGCTGALHLTLMALGVGPGDEVITTPLTYVATANAILYTGAKPVFVDVEKDSGLLDPEGIEAAITPRSKVILPVHLYGSLCDMKAIAEIASRHKLKIIEDSAHCIEGERDGIRPGMLGEAACYSFYATKNLTCGEGGAVATNDEALAAKIRKLRHHGVSATASVRYGELYKHWDMDVFGRKYIMDDIHAALLVKQVDRLDGYLKRREEICHRYERAISKIPGIKILKTKGRSARHLQTILVGEEQRDAMLVNLQKQGVGVGVHYRAVHTLDYYRKLYNFSPGDFPNAYQIGCRTLSLPLYPKLRDEEIHHVLTSLKRASKVFALESVGVSKGS